MNDIKDTAPEIEVKGIWKSYGPIYACSNISLSVNMGEIHGLLGQNGAGKSTLVKIISGVIKPDLGRIYFRGNEKKLTSASDAIEAGVGMVHQHFSLVGNLTVWENVALGNKGAVDKASLIKEIDEISEKYGLKINYSSRVEDLSIGEKQRVELIKCLQRKPDLVVLDEPTSVLSPPEAHHLFSVIREMVTKESKSVILVSHRLEEMTLIADKISVMRDGKLVKTTNTNETTTNSLARQMLGSSFEESDYKSKSGLVYEAELDPNVKSIFFFFENGNLAHTADTRDTKVTTPKKSEQKVIQEDSKHKKENIHTTQNKTGETSFDEKTKGVFLESLNAPSGDSRVGISNFNLHLEPNKIHGLAGVEGNGQDILVEVLSGLRKPTSGKLSIGQKVIDFSRSNPTAKTEIAVVPSDRHFSGCILDMTLAENLAFGKLNEFIHKGRIDYSKLHEHASELVEKFNISTPSLQTPFRFLSGGNQQRAVLAREIDKKPKLLVVSQPTFGLDVNAMSFIWSKLKEISEKDIPVLVISNDLDEILELSQTISVINRGSVVGKMSREDFDLEKFGLMIGEK
tara:strand:- start:4261 stop:5973 length:1713 start_codon:yes stop_codon:yes gene_type:complete